MYYVVALQSAAACSLHKCLEHFLVTDRSQHSAYCFTHFSCYLELGTRRTFIVQWLLLFIRL